MERIKDESIWLFCPELADIFVGCEALEGFEPLGKIITHDEVAQVAS